MASSILVYSSASSTNCSTTGIRWQLIPTVDSTVYGRSAVAGRSDTPTAGCLPPPASQ